MICAVVPAAGESRRMGAPKHLLPFGATTVIGHVVAELLRSSLDEVYLVVGRDVSRVVEELSGRNVRILTNPDPQADMLSSVRCGLRALPLQCAAVMVVLGDQPAVTAELIDSMLQLFRTAGKGILVPAYCGKRGHPLLFSARYCPEVLSAFDNVGLRGLLHAHPDDVGKLSVSTAAVLCDMDYPADYAREVARLQEQQITGKTTHARNTSRGSNA